MLLEIKAAKISRNRAPHTQLFTQWDQQPLEGHDFKRQDTHVAPHEPHTQPFGSGTTFGRSLRSTNTLPSFPVLFYSNLVLKFSEKWWAEVRFSNCYGQLSKLINSLQQVNAKQGLTNATIRVSQVA